MDIHTHTHTHTIRVISMWKSIMWCSFPKPISPFQ